MKIIAEIGTSHEGNIKKAFSLIDAAAEAGADIVKFQWVYAEEILHPKTGFVKLPGGDIPLYERFKSLEVSSDFFKNCIEYAHKRGLLFACSPFGLKSLHELCSINPDAIKIASPEVNHIPLLRECSKYFKKIPIILSSGVSTLGDIEKAVDILKGENLNESSYEKVLPPLTLLHCITSYPAPEEEYNTQVIQNLSNIFTLPCGVSDHSLSPHLIPVLSLICGGTMIEKHITLSRKTDGLDDPVALEPEQFFMMVHAVHQAEAILERFNKDDEAFGKTEAVKIENGMYVSRGQAEVLRQLYEEFGKEKVLASLGTGHKELAPAEKANYGRTNRSLHYMRDIKKGECITGDDISVLRTEKVLSPGIAPENLCHLLGKKLTQDVKSGGGVKWEDFLS